MTTRIAPFVQRELGKTNKCFQCLHFTFCNVSMTFLQVGFRYPTASLENDPDELMQPVNSINKYNEEQITAFYSAK